MRYNVQTTDIFEKQVKRLIKKYSSLKDELKDLIEHLQLNPDLGTSLGNNCFKIDNRQWKFVKE